MHTFVFFNILQYFDSCWNDMQTFYSLYSVKIHKIKPEALKDNWLIFLGRKGDKLKCVIQCVVLFKFFFFFFGGCRVLVPGLGIRPMPLAVDACSLPTGLPEKPPTCHFKGRIQGQHLCTLGWFSKYSRIVFQPFLNNCVGKDQFRPSAGRFHVCSLHALALGSLCFQSGLPDSAVAACSSFFTPSHLEALRG